MQHDADTMKSGNFSRQRGGNLAGSGHRARSLHAITSAGRLLRDERRDRSADRGRADGAAGDAGRYQVIAGQLREKHEGAIRALNASDVDDISVFDEVDGADRRIQKLCYGIYVLRDATPEGDGKVSSLGERMCVPIISAVLRQRGVPSTTVCASYLIVTDDQYETPGCFSTKPSKSSGRSCCRWSTGAWCRS